MNFDLPDDVQEILKLARDFAANELRPAEEAIDAIGDPMAAYTGPEHKSIMQKLYTMGFHKLAFPEELGGLGLPPMAPYVVLEELATGGAGLASTILVAPVPAHVMSMLQLQGRHEVYKNYAEAFIADTAGIHSGCWAITEPEVGSDFFTFDDPDIHFKTHARAVPDGDGGGQGVAATRAGGGYRIDGAKSAFVSNGYLADFILLMAGVEGGTDMSSTGTFLIPGDLDGITRGLPLNKLGLRALNQSEIFFDSVWVPEEMLVVPPGLAYRPLLDFIVTAGNTSVGILAVGVARAAYEAGLAHAKERVQGGKPIFEHQLVKMKLFDAFRSIEAARALLWRSAWSITQGRIDTRLAFAGRTVASQMALRVTGDMVELFGGYGISREYPVEKFFRDAKLLSIMDGTVDRVSLKGADLL